MTPKLTVTRQLRLSTRQSIAPLPPHPDDPGIHRVAILGERGGLIGIVSFRAEDVALITAALREAIGQ